eukprot:5480022-Prymnesium_polylepis.1
MFASSAGHYLIVRQLLNARTSVDYANNNGHTSLMVASQNNHVDCIRALCENGATIGKALPHWSGQWTALIFARSHGCRQAELALEQATDMDRSGRTCYVCGERASTIDHEGKVSPSMACVCSGCLRSASSPSSPALRPTGTTDADLEPDLVDDCWESDDPMDDLELLGDDDAFELARQRKRTQVAASLIQQLARCMLARQIARGLRRARNLQLWTEAVDQAWADTAIEIKSNVLREWHSYVQHTRPSAIARISNPFELVVTAGKLLEATLAKYRIRPSSEGLGRRLEQWLMHRHPLERPPHISRAIDKFLRIRNRLVHQFRVTSLPDQDRTEFVALFKTLMRLTTDGTPELPAPPSSSLPD